MNISNVGIQLIKVSESFKSHLYNCPANDCTIGYGHLVHKGPVCGAASEAPFVLGISEQQGTALLLEGCVVRGACRRAYGDGTVRYASLPFVKSLIVMN